jgi:hypothetical protein
MSTTDHTKAAGKSGPRNRKAPPRGQKADPQPTSRPEPKAAAKAQPVAIAASPKPVSNGTAAPADASSNGVAAPAKAAAAKAAPVSTARLADATPVSLQTIANAYSDCTKRSLDDIRSYVERLTGARSLDKAIEIQNEFAKRSFQSFVADSQKIFGLYGELAKQTFKPFAGFVAKATQAPR